MIEIRNLFRAYDDFMAVQDVSFSINKGEIVGLLGHNGAGKTTIMKMISGYLEPSSGGITIDDLDITKQREQIQQRLGYLPEVLPVYPEMNVADYLDYVARLKGMDSEQAMQEVRRVVKATDLGNKLIAPISTLSRGYRQRVGVAQAILGKPRLLILDEPTNGLDPTQTRQMRELIRDISKEATVILSTHIMQEVDALCDRVLIMRSGELALDATLNELRNSNRLYLSSDIDEPAINKIFKQIQGIQNIQRVDDYYQISIDEQADFKQLSNQISSELIKNNYPLYELKREQRDLESVFREVNDQVTEEVRDAA
jgi:ABC-2 type transport system ATP-binding protein